MTHSIFSLHRFLRPFFLSAFFLSAGLWGSVQAHPHLKVAVSQFVSHPALNQVYVGVREELTAQNFDPDTALTWIFENAQGNLVTNAQIAQKLIGLSPDVIVAIATPSAQAIAGKLRGTKSTLVFTAVTDPVGARLVKNLESPGGQITGTIDAPPLEAQFQLMQTLVPGLTRLGVLYNPGEANSQHQLHEITNIAEARGVKVIIAPAPKTAEVKSAAQSLVEKVDAFYIPLDNTVVSALEGVISVATSREKAVFSSDTSLVPKGVLAATGVSYYHLGRQTGRIVARILKGEKPGEISVESSEKTDIHLNEAMAERLRIVMPQKLLKRAQEIYK